MKRVVVFLLVPSLVAGATWFFCPRPSLDSYLTYSTAYLDRSGNLLRLTLAEDERYRIYRKLDQIAPEFVEATILYEDQGFYRHAGVDIGALLRAFWSTYITRERRIGGSTITMQVARLKWRIASNTIRGKVEQILRAIQLGRHYSKDEILEAYLNLAPYGRNIVGVGAASQIYFGKSADEISIPEALTLAVIPQNPVKRNPTTRAGFGRLLQARSNLFDRWLEHHPEDSEQTKYFDLPLRVSSPETLPFAAPHFVGYLERRRQNWEHGYLVTTIDLEKQRLIESLARQYVAGRRAIGISNTSVLLLNHETMAIEAMLGSVDFFDDRIQGQVNGTLSKRSPGSTLKPFVYGLALDDGLIHPSSLLKDAPRRFGGFTPENFDKRFIGPISAAEALIKSRNVPAVDLQARLKSKSFYQFLVDAGVDGLREEKFYGLALALGGGEMTMLELVSLYAALANQGHLRPTRALASGLPGSGKAILSPEASYLVLDILKDNPAPRNRLRFSSARPLKEIAWKTGTSWSFRDAWAIGISGSYVLAVWIGNFDGSGNRAFTGRDAAGPLMYSIFDAILPDQNWRVANLISGRSLNLKRLEVCVPTGDIYQEHCPAAAESWFIPGVSPIRVSNIFRQIPIDPQSGMRACWHRPGKTELRVFEFWSSDYIGMFNQAGISLKSPPPFAVDCDLEHKGGSGMVPVITSPQRSIEYIVSLRNPSLRRIPLEASVDSDVSQLHWFIDGSYVGAVARGETLFWNAIPGKFRARVVDDAGRAASKDFVVGQING